MRKAEDLLRRSSIWAAEDIGLRKSGDQVKDLIEQLGASARA
jgi:hypothetical protein